MSARGSKYTHRLTSPLRKIVENAEGKNIVRWFDRGSSENEKKKKEKKISFFSPTEGENSMRKNIGEREAQDVNVYI